MTGCQKGEVSWRLDMHLEGVLIANFFDMEQATTYANVGFTNVFYAIYDRCAYSSCNAVVVCFPYASNRSDICLDKIVLGKIYHSGPLLNKLFIPETPFSVMTRSGLNSRILSHIALTCCSSISRILVKSVSLVISIFVC